MIKIFASDLDGTLLPPTKIMPDETFGLIKKIKASGGLFVPASGRQLPNLLKLFSPVKDDVAIIAENGGVVWQGGKVIFTDPTPAQDVKRALDVIRKEKHLHPVVCCPDCAYVEDEDEKFLTVLKRSYSAFKPVADLDEVIGDESVIKISVWDELPAAEHGGIILPPKIDGLRTMISGIDWIDVSVKGANKGKALAALMQLLGVDKCDCVAFGDHMNDLEMLKASGKPFVTANAFPALKAQIGEEIPSNAEFGVITKIKELLNLQGEV